MTDQIEKPTLPDKFNDFDIDKDGDIDIKDMKSIYKSKTFWVNVVALIALGVQQKYGYVVDESMQVQALAVINVLLRTITSEPVTWSTTKAN
jgi:Ca2+-binding EF-hand superfamily protein